MSEHNSLHVAVRHRIGPLALDLALTLDKPWTVLFAPSGAGKSTLLRIIAGLLRPDSGRIVHASLHQHQVLTDTDTRVFIPPHRRAIRFVGQHAALFPNRSVLANVSYAAMPRNPSSRSQIEAVLALCRITYLVGQMPSTLSGGERQRVAIARAIAGGTCRMLLLDEPFSALDATMRRDLMANLKTWLAERNIPVLQVTHDVGEVFELCAHVVRMRDGKLVQQGSADAVLGEEKHALARQMNLVEPPVRT